MVLPLMPKATAVWLIDNTTLSFEQIADFCGLHILEVQGIADGEVAAGIQGMDPVTNGQVSREEIERCEKDPSTRMKVAKTDLPQPKPPSVTTTGYNLSLNEALDRAKRAIALPP